MNKQNIKYSILFTSIFISAHMNQLDILPLRIEELQEFTGYSYQELENILPYLQQRELEGILYFSPHHYVITNLIKKHTIKTACEVGVGYGTQSLDILKNTSIIRLYSIDPYLRFSQLQDGEPLNFEEKVFEVLYHIVKKRLAQYKDRSVLIRKPSVEAVLEFEDNTLDLVYIDANHEYESVKEDLAIWYNKVRPGGIISGNDYSLDYPGLIKAVNEFFEQKELAIEIKHAKWIVYKPN